MAPPTSTIPAVLRILQFGDSTFPVGAFSFSGGLEMAVQQGVVRDRADLAEYVHTVTRLAATGDGVALLHAHRGALAGDLDLIRRSDEAVHLRKLSEESRTMTLRMGRKLAETAAQIVGNSMLDTRLRDADLDSVPLTHPVALGALFAHLEIAEEDAFAVHQYGVAAVVLSAALRLMRVDHRETQAILYTVNASAAEEYQRVRNASLDDMAGFGPVIDILAAAHPHAHVRMFMN